MVHDAAITEVQELAPQLVQVTVAVKGGGFSFLPGQWVNFTFPEGVTRAYAIASAPQRPGAVQLCVRLGPGKGGEALQKLNVGDVVTLDGPHGDFVLPANDPRNVVLIAGDTGIAPARSIVLHLLATADPRHVSVLYEPDHRYILYAGDFDPLARSGRIIHESGPIEGLITRNRKRMEGAIVMIAGFDPFLERARKALETVDVKAAAVVAESFGPQPARLQC